MITELDLAIVKRAARKALHKATVKRIKYTTLDEHICVTYWWRDHHTIPRVGVMLIFPSSQAWKAFVKPDGFQGRWVNLDLANPDKNLSDQFTEMIEIGGEA